MIDADTIPHPFLFDIALSGLDVVLCPVPIYRADNPDGPVILNLVTQAGQRTLPIGANEYVEILEGGGGVMYISDYVLSKLKAPFRFGYDVDGVMERGEDHNFCLRAREAGFSVHAALGYPCGHAVEVNLKNVMEGMAATDASTRRLKIVVTGTGRSGTGFAAQWLTSVGLPCGHEAFYYFRGREGAETRLRTRPELVAESSWMAAPFLNEPQLRDALVIHQVRHPKKVIESCLRQPPGTTPAYLAFLEEFCKPVAEYEDDTNKAAARWVYWNRYIEQIAARRKYFFWKVEDGEEKLAFWLKQNGLEIDNSQPFGNRTYNHKVGEQKEAQLSDIAPELRVEMLEMCDRYGYVWDNE